MVHTPAMINKLTESDEKLRTHHHVYYESGHVFQAEYVQALNNDSRKRLQLAQLSDQNHLVIANNTCS